MYKQQQHQQKKHFIKRVLGYLALLLIGDATKKENLNVKAKKYMLKSKEVNIIKQKCGSYFEVSR